MTSKETLSPSVAAALPGSAAAKPLWRAASPAFQATGGREPPPSASYWPPGILPGQHKNKNQTQAVSLNAALMTGSHTTNEGTWLCEWLCSLACWVSRVSGSTEYRLTLISFLPSSLYLSWWAKGDEDELQAAAPRDQREEQESHLADGLRLLPGELSVDGFWHQVVQTGRVLL